jgi:hypothetical protein
LGDFNHSEQVAVAADSGSGVRDEGSEGVSYSFLSAPRVADFWHGPDESRNCLLFHLDSKIKLKLAVQDSTTTTMLS